MYTVICQRLSNISNGNVSCSLGDDEVLSYEDTCKVMCNPGYTLTGSDTRICLSNSNWSGTDGACKKGNNHYDCIAKYTMA